MRFHRGWNTLRCAAGLLCAVLAQAVPATAEDSKTARVVDVVGQVTARGPGGPTRSLGWGDPIHPGDVLISSSGARLGVLIAGVYAGLGENTTLGFDVSEDGAPALTLETGRLRVVDPDGGRSVRIATPGLLLASAGSDAEALAIRGKAGTVSMICPRSGVATVLRRAPEGARAVANAGQCVVEKRGEPLYTAEASHPALPVAGDAVGGIQLAGRAADRFSSPVDVAFGLPPVGAGPRFDLPVPSDRGGLRTACDDPGPCALPVVPSGFPSIGPP